MISIALALFLIGMPIWKKCFSSPQTMEAPPPAPSAPPMPTHNQPQIHRATPATNNQAHSHSHQHLVKKIPEEWERYWNNIQSDIDDEF
jgi:hypothetical protein